ncbi:MAG: BrnT family toxin [Defluviitaleaceae bacterium]|nr:BrnT family toxin [Defluviitaleaceae bacterium]MCL2262722.1 BrnT family toxin [Defluviitaleaceae bacterium]
MFEWDENKNQLNILKHGVSFEYARRVFDDPNRITVFDEMHSQEEDRFFCVGKVDGEILTVRFTARADHIRIIGAGYWRQGRKQYEGRN